MVCELKKKVARKKLVSSSMIPFLPLIKLTILTRLPPLPARTWGPSPDTFCTYLSSVFLYKLWVPQAVIWLILPWNPQYPQYTVYSMSKGTS